MARISTYENDENISGEDKVLGTDADSQNQTKNFTVNGIADFALDKLIEPDATEGYVPVFGASGTTISDSIITSIEGTATIGGNLRVTLDSTLEGTLTVSSSAELNSTLDVSGSTTLNSTLDVTGATALGNTLGVVGATTLNDTLTVTEATALNSTLSVTGATNLGDVLNVTGVATLNDTLTVANATNLNGTLDVSNSTTLLGSLDVAGDTYLHRLKIAGSDVPFQEEIDFQVGNFDEAAEIRLVANVEFGNGNVPTTSDFYSDVTVQGDGGGSFTFKGTAPVFTKEQTFPQGVSAGHQNNVLGNAAFMGGIGLTGNGDYSVILGRNNDETSKYVDVNEKTILQVGGGGGTGSKINALTIVRTGNTPSNWEFNLVMEWLATQSDYSNDSEAGGGGVPIGGLYRTGSDVKIRVN